MIKERKTKLTILVAIISLYSHLIYAETEHFEKGDLLFRKGFMWYGHTAIYYGWDRVGDPNKRENHLIIESDSSWSTLPEPGVMVNTYSDLYNKGYKGAGTLNLYAEERQRVVDFANSRRGYKYAFTKGYKDQTIETKFYKTYRCDGLAEHAYEVARNNYGIVIDTHWNGALPQGLYPYKQQEIMGEALGMKPSIDIPIVTPSENKDGKYHIKDKVVIKCDDVSDGERGSGIAKVEFWLGDLSTTPQDIIETGTKIGQDTKEVLIKGDYSYEWNTAAIKNGDYLLYAKAFDQAGNTDVSNGLRVIVNNGGPVITDASPIGTITNKRPTIQARVYSPDGIDIDLSSVMMTLDGLIVSHSVDPFLGGPDIIISYVPNVDLVSGQHSVTVNATDVNGLAAEEKVWIFNIEENIVSGQYRGTFNGRTVCPSCGGPPEGVTYSGEMEGRLEQVDSLVNGYFAGNGRGPLGYYTFSILLEGTVSEDILTATVLPNSRYGGGDTMTGSLSAQIIKSNGVLMLKGVWSGIQTVSWGEYYIFVDFNVNKQ